MKLPARLLLLLAALSARAEYDPLKIPDVKSPEASDCTISDIKRHREIPIRIFLPATTNAAPVVLFSHGLGGSRENNGFLGRHWAARGYVAVFMQHPGSDESVWKNQAAANRLGAMKGAADAKNFLLRVKDVPAVIDALAAWNKTAGHSLSGRMDLEHIGMSGHSFGALTTQAVSGQSGRIEKLSFTDPRIGAAVMFSPSTPAAGGDPRKAFGTVKIPWMLMTGTQDVSLIGGATVESRLGVYPALPPGSKYEVVLDKAEHSAFSERALPGDKVARNPNHHRVMLGLTTAFWDAYLKKDADALAWLNGDGPAGLLEKEDRWQKK